MRAAIYSAVPAFYSRRAAVSPLFFLAGCALRVACFLIRTLSY